MAGFRNESIDSLVHALANLTDEEGGFAFLEDLCTIKEIQDMAQRFRTAGLLRSGMNYVDISSSLGISTTTISRVSRALNYGSGGYSAALKAVEADTDDNK